MNIDQILLRGTSLRNTEWIYGVAIYTGHETKVMKNSAKNKPKFSKIEIATNKFIRMGILVQTGVCLAAAILNSIWELVLDANSLDHYYLELDVKYDVEKH